MGSGPSLYREALCSYRALPRRFEGMAGDLVVAGSSEVRALVPLLRFYTEIHFIESANGYVGWRN